MTYVKKDRPIPNLNLDEFSIIVCKLCGETKKRYIAGKYPNGKDKKYVDENGKEFSGHRCPQCHKEKAAQLKRIQKAAKELGNE